MEGISQLDPRWASQKLGASQLTCAGYGCTTCCISKISEEFGCYKSPLELARRKENYTKDGLVLWKAFDANFDGKMRFVWRGYGPLGAGKISAMTDFSPILNALQNPDKRVIIQVNNGAHWLKLNVCNGGRFMAMDPLGGKECDAVKKYKNITGYAIFERDPQKIEVSPYAKEAVELATKLGIVTQWANPREIVCDATAEAIFMRTGLLKRKTAQGGVTKEDLTVMLYAMGELK